MMGGRTLGKSVLERYMLSLPYPSPAEFNVYTILCNEVLPEDRKNVIAKIVKHDLCDADGKSMRWVNMAQKVLHDDKVYRVSIVPDGVNAICFGLESVDSKLSGHYDSVDALPKWVQERLAVLMITPSTPPTYEVEGVGRRISSHVYWVFAPEHTS